MHLKPILGEKEMEPNTPLWRYMKLSTFLLLLKGTAFIPLLSKLQEGDPKEGRASTCSTGEDEVWESDVFQKAVPWLEKKHTSRRFDLSEFAQARGFTSKPHLLNEWRFQLSIRRCAWCWCAPGSQAPGDFLESMAMGNLYARDGVAVKPTLGQLREAIVEPGLEDMLVLPIRYGGSCPDLGHATRPFVFKSQSCEHEKEVRLVFSVNAVVVSSGVKMRQDPRKLLDAQEVIISPYVLADEADAIEHVAREILPGLQVKFRLSSELANGDSDPRNGVEWEDGLRRHVGLFSAEDGLPELLQDL